MIGQGSGTLCGERNSLEKHIGQTWGKFMRSSGGCVGITFATEDS